MDGESHSSLWERLGNLFSKKGEDQLEQAIMEARADGDLKAEEGTMLLSILNMDDMQVQDLMTPRTDVDCLACGVNVLTTAKAIVETGHSRLPIYQGTKDNIVGIIYAKDLLECLIDPQRHGDIADKYMRPSFFVPETKKASELLQEFRVRKNHIAIVVDEYGGTSGLITIEDLLEQIVGEIEDEHDAPREIDIVKLDENHLELAGRAYLEDLQEYGIELESEEVETIGGYLSQLAGHVPQESEIYELVGWKFVITVADQKQIHKISAVKLEEGETY